MSTRRNAAAPERQRRLGGRVAAVLVVFATVFVALEVRAYRQTSATWDEPIHVAAGYAALAEGDYRVDPSHPPLLRMWAALPLLASSRVSMDATIIDRVPPARWLTDAYRFAHQFLYRDNDADRLLYSSRFMIVLLGVGLGVLLFAWAHQWLGLLPAAAALAAYTFEPNLGAHASLVTTDFGLTVLVFGAAYFAWRLHRGCGRASLAGLAAFAALAVVSKFSGLLILPVIAMLLAVMVARQSLSARRALVALAVVVMTSFAAVWAVYGFRYLPGPSPSWTFELQNAPVAQGSPTVARIVDWIDTRQLLPNAYVQGAFYTQTSVTQLPAFLAGEISEDGWWYYFPAAFALKAPLAMLFLLACGIAVAAWRWRELGAVDLLCVSLPVAVFLGVAMASGVNIGLRHILPIYPFLILLVAVCARELRRVSRRTAVAAIAVVSTAWTYEFAAVYPHTLTFFNQIVGPQDGYRYLADSNLGWGQSLKGLKAWMDGNGVSHVNLVYFGQADPGYYDIDCTFLPGGPAFAIDAIERPKLPGYVALSTTVLSGVYLPSSWRLFYDPFTRLEPVTVIGNAMRVYWVEQWPDASASSGRAADLEAHRSLAEALLYGLQWPARAALHYQEYLRHRPRDSGALVDYGLALVATNRVDDGMAAFRQAVDADGNHGNARLTLGKALFGSRDLPGAVVHAEAAARLMPGDAEAHHFLGRVRAAQGRFDQAAREFEQVIQLQPAHAEAHELLRRVRAVMGTQRPIQGRRP